MGTFLSLQDNYSTLQKMFMERHYMLIQLGWMGEREGMGVKPLHPNPPYHPHDHWFLLGLELSNHMTIY